MGILIYAQLDRSKLEASEVVDIFLIHFPEFTVEHKLQLLLS